MPGLYTVEITVVRLGVLIDEAKCLGLDLGKHNGLKFIVTRGCLLILQRSPVVAVEPVYMLC